MGMIFKSWGLDGSLVGMTDFWRVQTNGYVGDTGLIGPSTLGDRVVLVQEDGYSALLTKLYDGDPETALGLRTEIVPNDYADILDWVGESVPGATEDDAKRRYRIACKVPSQDLSGQLAAGTKHLLVFQLHQVPDKSPADTAGGNPALALHITYDGWGRLWWVVRRNVDPTETITVADGSIQQRRTSCWPFRFDVWEDIHVEVGWSYSSLGYMSIWRNRRPVFVEVGAVNCPNNSPARGGSGIYAKAGCYLYPPQDFRVYHRGIIIGDKDATFADMYPELDGAVPLERVSGPSSARGY